MELSSRILSDVTVYLKYARYIEKEKRRETWEEIVDRNKKMHTKKFPSLKDEIEKHYKFVYDRKVLPSMRALQFGGKPIEISPNRQYNCAYTAIDSWESFQEVMFLLLGGTGVGYSVQKHHIEKLPEIKPHLKRTKRHLISDSIEGWADAVGVLVRSYFEGLSKPRFDFSDIREKGALLKTSGGKAPGPQPLKDCIHNLKKILDSKEAGSKLTPLEVHDMICYIADAVLAGGIRRAALISLFSMDDEDMITCKYGNWWELNPQRGRANNSAVVLRHRIRKKKFLEFWERIKLSGSGEPGIYFSNDKEWGANPCVEIGLRDKQFCNLVTINVSNVEDQADLNARAEAASFIATLQASYTDFHYLRDIWRETTEKDALIGVSMTGIASGSVLDLDLTEAAEIVIECNKRTAKELDINPAARLTAIKPEGTASLVLGSSSGIHGWFSKYYIRRLIVLKSEPIYRYLKKAIPQLVEDDKLKPLTQAMVCVPIKAPDGAIFRDEPALDLAERVKKFSQEWIQPGHIKGQNSHNVSATLSLHEDEWDQIGKWMWENRNYYNGLSVIPFDGGTYTQAPHEEIDEARYTEMIEYLKRIDLRKVTELEDNTNLKGEIACGGPEGCMIV